MKKSIDQNDCIFTIVLNKQNEYGLTLSGGKDHETPIYISKENFYIFLFKCFLGSNRYICIYKQFKKTRYCVVYK